MKSSILSEIAERYHLKNRGGKWVGPCPECGGSSRSDKFNLRDDGGFKCYSCDFKGDIITWLRKMEGKSCPEAYEAAGLACERSNCPVWSTCRMGDGTGRKKFRPSSVKVQRRKSEAVGVSQASDPKDIWRTWAQQLVEYGRKSIQDNRDVVAWLERRGISLEAVCRFGIGWLPRNGKVLRDRIGLPVRDDGKTTVWVPDGLLIPIFDRAGIIHRLRVRRQDSSRERFLPDLKYVWLEGSGSLPMIIDPPAGCELRGAVIVESELDAMAVADAHCEVMVVSLGTVRSGLSDELKEELGRLPVILVGLDADQPEAGKKAAGPEAIKAWLHDFRQARYWPVPVGKDPGEMAEQGGDLNGWVEAGLPVKATGGHELHLTPEGSSLGEGGEDIPSSAQIDEAEWFTSHSGREFCVVRKEELWRDFVAECVPVFSENEIRRLHTATAGMAPGLRAEAAEVVLDIKEVFAGAYIRRGEGLSGGSNA